MNVLLLFLIDELILSVIYHLSLLLLLSNTQLLIDFGLRFIGQWYIDAFFAVEYIHRKASCKVFFYDAIERSQSLLKRYFLQRIAGKYL